MVSDQNGLGNRLRISIWIVTLVVCFLSVFENINFPSPRPTAYLDLSDSVLAGHWRDTLSLAWSPLFVWILGLTRILFSVDRWAEQKMVCGVLFFGTFFAMATFDFFIRGLILNNHLRSSSGADRSLSPIPPPALYLFGFSVFIWACLHGGLLQNETPDIFVAGFTFLIAGAVLRVRAGNQKVSAFVALGFAFGCGYLMKTILLPLSMIDLATAGAAVWLNARNWRLMAGRMAIALSICLVVASPVIYILSQKANRFSYGEAGRVAFLTQLNKADRYGLPDQTTAIGNRAHAPVRIFDDPPAYYYAGELSGTFPPIFDPVYSLDGLIMNTRFDVVWPKLKENILTIFNMFIFDQTLLILFMAGLLSTAVFPIRRLFLEHWTVTIPAVMVVFAYLTVHVEDRYVSPFLTLLLVGSAAALQIPSNSICSKWAPRFAISLFLITAVASGYKMARKIDDLSISSSRWLVDQFADFNQKLSEWNLQPGEKVAYMEKDFIFYAWARASHFTIAALIDSPCGEPSISKLQSQEGRKMMAELKARGIRTIVGCLSRKPPAQPADGHWIFHKPLGLFAYRISD